MAGSGAYTFDYGGRYHTPVFERGGGNRVGASALELFPVAGGDIIELLRADAGDQTMVY